MAYKYRLFYPDGDSEESEQSYETEELAREAALYDCSCFQLGGEELRMSGDDYVEGEVEYEVYEE